MTETPWLTEHPDGVVITVRATPRGKRTEIIGVIDGALRIRVQAPPVDGKANKVLIKFLSRQLGCPASAISLIGGATARHKRLHIRNITATQLRAAL
jgi:uncharacterized protein (TIGR00251 family)